MLFFNERSVAIQENSMVHVPIHPTVNSCRPEKEAPT
jgi:hypothetical protein